MPKIISADNFVVPSGTADQILLANGAVSVLSAKADLNSPTFTGTVSGVTKTMVGLGNVDNTSDVAKPVSTAAQTVLNTKVDGKYGQVKKLLLEQICK